MFNPFGPIALQAITTQLKGKVSQLPVFELSQQSVLSIGGSVQVSPATPPRPVTSTSSLLGGATHSPLTLNAWEFFHAAAKTELSRGFSAARSRQHGAALFSSLGDLIKWNRSPVRLRQEGVFSRKDASRTYVLGRFGEAVSYLFMKSKGYVYWDHLPSLVERCISSSSANHPERTKKAKIVKSRLRRAIQGKMTKGVLAEPDFAFEKSNQDIALLESKGRMVTPGKKPNFKADMSKALSQLSAWQSIISGRPKAFATGTYLREVADSLDESIFAFVDPPGEEGDDELQVDLLDESMIRRGNYAAWFRGMGLPEPAESIAFQQPGTDTEYQLSVFSIRGVKFVFPNLIPFEGTDFPFMEMFWMSPRHFREAYLMLTGWRTSALVGLELSVMRKAERVLKGGVQRAFGELPNLEIDSSSELGFSVFPDGSIFGDAVSILRESEPMDYELFRF